jgi:hypothetical protein
MQGSSGSGGSGAAGIGASGGHLSQAQALDTMHAFIASMGRGACEGERAWALLCYAERQSLRGSCVGRMKTALIATGLAVSPHRPA